MSTELKIAFALVISAALMLIGSFGYSAYEMLKEYKEIEDCRNMPINDFFQDDNCKKYREVIENERK